MTASLFRLMGLMQARSLCQPDADALAVARFYELDAGGFKRNADRVEVCDSGRWNNIFHFRAPNGSNPYTGGTCEVFRAPPDQCPCRSHLNSGDCFHIV